MDLLMISGKKYCTLNIDINKTYSCRELKNIMSAIKSDNHFSIVQNNSKIYTDLFDVRSIFPLQITDSCTYIIFHQYSKNDTSNVIAKCRKMLYTINKNNNLQSEFNLSVDNLHSDELFMTFCVSQHGDLLYYASDELKNNVNVLNYARNTIGNAYLYMSDQLKDDKNFISLHTCAYKYASDRLKNDLIFTQKIIDKMPYYFEYVSENLRNNKQFVKTFLDNEKNKIISRPVYNYYNCIQLFGDKPKNDKTIINRLIDIEKILLNNSHYYYVCFIDKISNYLKNDFNIVNKFLQLEQLYYDNCKKTTNIYDRNIYCHIGKNLKTNVDIIKKCVILNANTLIHVSHHMNLTKDLITLAYESDNCRQNFCDKFDHLFNYVDDAILDDYDVVINVIKKSGINYIYISDRLKKDDNLLMEAISHCYYNMDNICCGMNNDDIRIDRICKILQHSNYKNCNNLPWQIQCVIKNKLGDISYILSNLFDH